MIEFITKHSWVLKTVLTAIGLGLLSLGRDYIELRESVAVNRQAYVGAVENMRLWSQQIRTNTIRLDKKADETDS